MWVKYSEDGFTNAINSANITKMEVDGSGSLYFFGAPCADDEGGIHLALVDFIKFESQLKAEDALTQIITAEISGVSIYQVVGNISDDVFGQIEIHSGKVFN